MEAKKISCVYRIVLVLGGERIRVERGKAILGDFSIFDSDLAEKVSKAVSENLKTQLKWADLPKKIVL